MSFEKLGLTPRVLDTSEIDEVLEFETSRLKPEDMIMSWHAPWRKEALEHYIPKGWCFALRNGDGLLAAYFLAQPLIFYRGLTQTLWVEHMGFREASSIDGLVDLARKYARDKHLQKVVFNSEIDLSSFGAEAVTNQTYEFKTTKMS